MSGFRKYYFLLICIYLFIHISAQEDDDDEDKLGKKDPIYVVPREEKLNYYQYHYDEVYKSRAGKYRKPAFATPEIIWVKRKLGTMTAQPFGAIDHVIVGTNTKRLYYLDPKTGDSSSFSVKVKGTPFWIGNNDEMSTLSTNRIGFLFSYVKSNLKWQYRVKAFNHREQLWAGSLAWGAGVYISFLNHYPVFVDCNKKRVINKKSGKLDAELTVPMAVIGTDVILCTADGRISAYDKGFSRVRYYYKLPTSYATAMIVEKQYLYVASADKMFRKVEFKKKKVIWEVELDGKSFNSIVKKGSEIFVPAGSFYIFNDKDGRKLFKRPTIGLEGFGRTKPLITKDRIYVCDRIGNFFIFEKKTKAFMQVINLNADVMMDFFVMDKILIIGTTKAHILGVDLGLY
ncbi:MAG: hypothetical protein COA79_10060 [Planctomycetota bacterium]|nr:MAG: hypothetical protein COA79_10060 [Planctomycetota bacterium]